MSGCRVGVGLGLLEFGDDSLLLFLLFGDCSVGVLMGVLFVFLVLVVGGVIGVGFVGFFGRVGWLLGRS